MKEFSTWYQKKTVALSAMQKRAFRLLLQKKLCKSHAVLSRWISGKSEPNDLEKKSINIILKQKIYGN
ncbi:MAG: hypothetical protein IJU33_02290 [Bacteroidales bacterium]|nr:hypothetical protein [Bacteroidales bacterium]